MRSTHPVEETMNLRQRTVCLLPIALALFGCSSSSDSDARETPDLTQPEDHRQSDAKPQDTTPPDATPDLTSHDAADLTSLDQKPTPDLPTGPTPPAVKSYSNGTCPTFTAGKNDVMVGTRKRSFELWIPAVPKGAPVVFIWHGLGDTPTNIATYFQASKLASERGAIVVAPYDCCSSNLDDCCATPYVWGFGTYSSDSDITMFDDILSCLEQEADIDNTRVYTTGFSAGALWSTNLVVQRGEYLAAAVIFSGGTGNLVKYETPKYKVPVLLAHGGDDDIFAGGLVKFKSLITTFAEQLYNDGHFVAICDHGLGHSVPYDGAVWDAIFLFAHQWSDGSSPFKDGLTSDFPDYCQVYSPR